ncbi:MAG: class I SAM-dependent methyltransferase [Microthrixaceae bacterium]|nr:class I SAM-dependent methyltransferase [Microthrixaceae bacterium]
MTPAPAHGSHAHDKAVPAAGVDESRVAGHWLLARMGKRVLRPGGVETTQWLLDSLAIGPDDDIVEVAPGMGATTRLLLDANPASYTGVDRDPEAAALVGDLLAGGNRRIVNAPASETGLPDNSVDVVVGEAYLTMQPESVKRRTIAELARILRPGGRFALHEIAFAPNDIDDDRRKAVTDSLTSSIKVSVNPITVNGWRELLAEYGIITSDPHLTPLHLLEPRRLLNDEGVLGATKFVFNVARNPAARKRVKAMRASMRANAANLQAIGLTGRLSDDG